MNAIAAMSNNRVIGVDGKLPWKNTGDMQFFKRMTIGQTVVMGRKTYNSLPKLTNEGIFLPNRTIIVLSNTENPLAKEFSGFDAFVYIRKCSITPSQFCPNGNNVWISGGGQIYEQFLPVCEDLYLTIMLDDYEGDTYMPDFDHLFPEQRVIAELKNMWIVHYWRQTSPLRESFRDGFDAALMGLDEKVNPYKINYKKFFDDDVENDLHLEWNAGWVKATRNLLMYLGKM